MARLQRHPEVKVICFYQSRVPAQARRHDHALSGLRGDPFPVDPARVEAALRRAVTPGD
jgi:hypothetical protein